MADKHFIRESIQRLQEELRKMPDSGGDKPAEWKAQRDVLLAEVSQIVELALPPSSPLIGLLKDAIEEVSPPSLGAGPARHRAAASDSPPLVVVARVLEAANRWNEARFDEEAIGGLSEDINRVLSRKLLTHPLTAISTAILVIAVGFFIGGSVRIRGVEADIKKNLTDLETETITKLTQQGNDAKAGIDAKRKEAEHSVENLEKQVQETRTRLETLKAEVSTAVKEAREEASRQIEAQGNQAKAEIDETTKVATQSIQKQAQNTVKSLNAQINEDKARLGRLSQESTEAVTRLRDSGSRNIEIAVNEARGEIARAAQQRAAEVKQQTTPEFEEKLKEDLAKLENLEDGLKQMDSRQGLLDAALRATGMPDKGIVSTLAAVFKQTVAAVYIVLGLLLLMLILNVALFIGMLRGRSKPRKGAITGEGPKLPDPQGSPI